ncbi:MAG: NAD(P)/FAD-dependent oxidoreductase [Kiritimatiellaeota bacterium]|nr:NAD(P)/FAD-dependent oxidoreductase [Kiritimatiellota bacterium]
MKYDCVIIGAGLSGMAAAVRLAHFGKKVLVCERHSRIGGLNSYYSRRGELIESGLHAMTNFAAKGAPKSLPLSKLLRQLRIPYGDLAPRGQNGSKIDFPDAVLEFSNDFAELADSVAKRFPHSIDKFLAFDEFVGSYDGLNVTAGYVSARSVLKERLDDELLIEMLFCPLMYYGSAVVDDMDFAQFAIMYKSIFREGFCRPAGGIKALLDILERRFVEGGGEILEKEPRDSRFPERGLVKNCRVATVNVEGGVVSSATLESGEIVETEKVLSSAGLPETESLISASDASKSVADTAEPGVLGFVETVAKLDAPMSARGYDTTITFFNNSAEFAYRPPEEPVSAESGVVCCPDNFRFEAGDFVPTPQIRVTMLANPDAWNTLRENRSDYESAKIAATETALKVAARISRTANIADSVVFTDTFTPNTITRHTERINGAVYGSPMKSKDGRTKIKNLFICGTDQGFLGITGSMLSGISMANMHLLA